MWELDHKEGWALKNWCFRTVVLEKTLENPLDCKINQVNPKGIQPWIFIGRTNAETEAPIVWSPDAKSQLTGKDPDAGKVKVIQLCQTLRDPMDCSPPGSSVHGILQARILELVAFSFSRGSPQPRDWTQVSHIAGGFFTIWATREAWCWEMLKAKREGAAEDETVKWHHWFNGHEFEQTLGDSRG